MNLKKLLFHADVSSVALIYPCITLTLVLGAEGRVTLIHPSKNKMFAHLPVFKKAYISCLRLHPGNVNWLFCGADHGKIALIDTGLSGSTDYKIAWQKIKMVIALQDKTIHWN